MGYTQALAGPVETFTHIIVDESQDLSRLQLSFLRHFLKNRPYATITFLYDTSQSIYPASWIGMKQPFSSVGFDVTGSPSAAPAYPLQQEGGAGQRAGEPGPRPAGEI